MIAGNAAHLQGILQPRDIVNGWTLMIAIAYPFHRLIEVPSMRLAGRFKQDRGPSAATGFCEPLPPMEDEKRTPAATA